MTALIMKNAPKRLVSRTSRQASIDIRMIRSSRVTPALLTRMSIFANASRTVLTTESAASACEASPWIASDRRPSASTAATVSPAAAALPL